MATIHQLRYQRYKKRGKREESKSYNYLANKNDVEKIKEDVKSYIVSWFEDYKIVVSVEEIEKDIDQIFNEHKQ